MSLIALLLAAGRSSRMGGADKLMMPVGGQPCLRVMTMRLLQAKLRVLVTVPDLLHNRNTALSGLDVLRVPVADADQGMARSIAAGIRALPAQTPAVMILPSDMPDLEVADFEAMSDSYQSAPDSIWRATDKSGSPGHPVIFPDTFFVELSNLRGDKGAREVLRNHPDQMRHMALPGAHATTDLDTPQEWEAWNKRD